MDGFEVMASPLALLLRIACLAVLSLALVGVAERWGRRGSARRRLPLTSRRARLAARGRTSDAAIVAAYDHAVLHGWRAGETATFIHVGRVVGTSAEHVRAVIARHWAG